MFVIADIEWVTNSSRAVAPTQLSALRVDSSWGVVDKFNSLIKPKDESFHIWEHVAYSGSEKEEFLNARGAHYVMESFAEWLAEDDVVLWWHYDLKNVFDKIFGNLLKYAPTYKFCNVSDYVYTLCKSEGYAEKNPYRLAEKLGAEILHPMHSASNDVEVVRRLLEKIKLPQSLISDGKTNGCEATFNEHIQYIYDVKENVIHQKSCEKVNKSSELKGYGTLKRAVDKQYKACECCRGEYREILREKNKKLLAFSNFIYVYTQNSDVYHRSDCAKLHFAKNLMGTYSYESMIKLGKRACKICKPVSNKIKFSNPQKIDAKRNKNVLNNVSGKAEKNAVERHREAVLQREKMLKNENLTPEEKNDIYTLTQPRFAFWAGQGYQTFHSSGCAKLKGLSHLKGFSTYKEALSYNLSPCRLCKPTAKQDITLSIPITSKIRHKESFYCLEDKAERAGFGYSETDGCVNISTPVGKWKIHCGKLPIKLEHINLLYGDECGYHDQPKIFLSYSDTFNYIKRHDESLMERGIGEENLLTWKLHCL